MAGWSGGGVGEGLSFPFQGFSRPFVGEAGGPRCGPLTSGGRDLPTKMKYHNNPIHAVG